MRFFWRCWLLPMLFLLSYAMSSDAFRFAFGVDLSFIIVLLFVLFYLFAYKYRIKGGINYSWWLYLLVIPTLSISLFMGDDVVKMIFTTFALLLPFALEPFVPSNDKTIIVGMYFTFGISLIILILYSNFNFLGNWNPNCIAYLSYLGIAGAVVILSCNKKNIILWAVLGFAFLQLLLTQSRNAMSALALVVLLLIFKELVSKKLIYRVVYGFAILYPSIFPALAMHASNTKIYSYLKMITADVFDKSSVFSGRNVLFQETERILESSLFNNIFGFGNTVNAFISAHNDFYCIRFAYGIIGTIIIAGLLVLFFEKAYTLIRKGDNIVYGCTIVFVGILFQQASEGWFIAVPLIILMSFVYMAIVIKRIREYETETRRRHHHEHH